ncbi:MAG: phage tail protein [Roseiarcus sp.]|jgi:phage tail-like protein
MADDGSAQGSTWPLPKFYFSVDIADVGTNLPFQEVTGLDAEAQVIEYRAGNSKAFSTIKMPGIVKSGNVTLKKGVFVKDNKFWDWFNQRKMNLIKRSAITIKLLDQDANPTMTWTLTNAWPTKITSTDLKADGNEVAVETIEIAHEGVTIANK